MNYAGKFGSGGLDPVSGVDIDLGALSPHGHLSSPGKVHVDKISTHAPSDAIIIPDAHLLFHGDFKRSGVDLILSSGDRELLLRDYFKGEKRPALASPDGAHLTGDLVNALSGHTQFAQADGSASVAPQMIGHVTKLVGSATAIRNGVSIILNQGDTVHKGDVVQSGSDSTLGITFIDGTVFGLASNAKMVLNEMVYDPNGSDNKSLLSLVQGTISFVAGATAKKGDMKVDTPVATMGIRGTAVLVEIDFEVPGSGSAPPAKFQVLVEPDGTTGSYILFDKTTLTPIATVNQAGTQTIINGQGAVSFSSSVQLSPDAQKIISDVFSLKFTDLNSPNTKLTTNFTDSIIPQTSFLKLASNDFIPVTLQVVNVPDKPTAPSSPGPSPFPGHIAGPPAAVANGGSVAELIDTTGSVVANIVSGKISYADVNPDDIPSVKAAFSSFIYANAQGANVTATLTAEQLAAIKAVEVPLTVVQDPNGKNTGTATWTYTIADGAFDFLADGEKLTLTYMARVDTNYAPANETTFVPFTIVVTGTNDKPTLTSTGGATTERIGTGNATMDVATGTVTFADADLTDKPVVSTSFSDFKYVDVDGNDIAAELTPEQLAAIALVEIPLTVAQTAGNSNKGTATWTYSIADSAFDFLAKGETLTLNYVAEVDDGHGGVVRTPISVSINGADINDDPTITTTSNAFIERANDAQPNPTGSPLLDTVSGTIGFTDVDLTDRPVASAAFESFAYRNASDVDVTSSLSAAQLAAIIAVEKPLSVVQTAGNTNDGSATWTYSAADGAFDFLADGETLTLTYTATVDDGHGGVVTKPLTVTVTGTNDTPSVVSGPQASTIAERADTSGSTVPDTAGGSVTFKDADLTDTHDVTIKGVSASGDVTGLANGAIQLGWLSLGTLAGSTGGATGSKSWSFSAPDGYFDYLAQGDAVTLTYTVQIDDHHGGIATQDIVVTVTGSNDAPSIVGEVDPAVQTVNVLAPIVLPPGANDNSLGLVSETFDSLPSGSFSSVGVGFGNFYSAVLDATFSATGDAGLVNGQTAPFSTIQFGPLPARQDTTNYLVAGTFLSAETITFNAEKNAFGLYWGTIDPQNQIYFYNGTSLVASYTGADLMPLFASGNRGNLGSDGYVEFLGLPLFDKVVLTGGFFESDNIVAGNIPAPTPGLSGPVKGTLSVYDADIGNTLTAFVTGDATIEYNGSPSVPGNVDLSALIDAADITFGSAPSNGGTALLNWTYQPTNPNLAFLNVGDVLKITYIAEVSDGYGNVGSQPLTITLVGANGATSTSASLVSASLVSASLGGGPVIGTDTLAVTENADGTKKVSGLYVSDNDASAPNDTFTIAAVADAADAGVTPSGGKGSLAAVNAALDSGVTYDPGSNPPQTDMVKLTVSDGFGHSDTVHFVFNEAGDGPVILNGTSGKDVIFATGADDTLTGGASADQFVFAPEPNPSSDTITDFAPGEDRIDLRLFAGVVDSDNVDGWLAANAAQSSTNPADVQIALGNDTLTLKNVAIANLHAGDFIVSPHHVGA